MNIASLTIQMAADVAKLRSDMESAKGVVSDAMQSIERAADVAGKALGALGVAASVGGLIDFVKSTIEATAQLHHMSEQAGVSAQSLSAMRSVAKLSGTDMGDVVGSLQKLSKSMVDAQGGTGKAAEAFKALGVNIFDSTGKLKGADQVQLEVAKSLANFKDGAATTAVKIDLMGKSAANLAPFLKDLAERGELNGKVTAEQARQADEFQKSIIKTQSALKGWFTALALDLLPALEKLGGLIKVGLEVGAAYFALFYAAPAAFKLGQTALNAFGDAVYAASMNTGTLSQALGNSVGQTMSAIEKFGLLKTAALGAVAAFAGWEIGTWLVNNFAEARAAGVYFVESTLVGWERIKFAGQAMWLAVQDIFYQVIEAVGSGFGAMGNLVSKGLAAMGFKDAAAQTEQFSASIRSGTRSGFDFNKQLAALESQTDANIVGIKAITSDMLDAAYAQDKNTEANAKGAKELKYHADAVAAARDAYAKLLESLKKTADQQQQKLQLEQFELDTGHKLTAAEVEYVKVIEQVRDGKVKLNDLIANGTLATLQNNMAVAAGVEQQKAAAKATLEALQVGEKTYQQTVQETSKLRDQNDMLAAQNETLRTGVNVVRQLETARLRASASQLDALAITEQDKNLNFQLADAYKAQAAELRRRADLLDQGVAIKEAKAANAEWQKTIDSIGNGLSDALMRAFESGKGFMQAFRDTLVNAFKTLVLQPTIKAIFAPVAGAMGSALGMGNAVAGTGSMLGGAGSMLGSFGAFGGAAGSGFSMALAGGTMDALAGGAAMVSEAAGLSSAMAGVGQIMGALGPWALGALAIASLFGGKKSATLGYANGSIGAGGAFSDSTSRFMEFGRGDSVYSSDLAKLTRTLNTSISATASALGGRGPGAGFGIGAYTDLPNDGQASGSIQFFRNGQRLGGLQTGGTNPLQVAAGRVANQQALSEWFANSASAAIIFGLQQSTLPKRMAEYFKGVDAFALTQDKAAAMLATASAVQSLTDGLAPLGSVFAKLGGLSVQATADLAAATGGFDAFVGKVQGFVKDYYSTDEQNAIAAAQVQRTLQAAGIDTSNLSSRAQYRALVDNLDVSTADGQKQLAALLNASAQFAQLSDVLGSSGKSLADLASTAPQVAALGDLTAATQDTAQSLSAVSDQIQISNTRLQSIDQSLQSLTQLTQQNVTAANNTANALSSIASGAALNRSAPGYNYNLGGDA